MFDIQAARKRCEAVLGDVPLGAHVLRWVFEPTRKGWGRVWAEIKVDSNGMVGTTGLPGTVRVLEHIGEFIAHARSDLPAALEALEEAQGKLGVVREWMTQELAPCPEDDRCLDCRLWYGLDRILSKEGNEHDEMR